MIVLFTEDPNFRLFFSFFTSYKSVGGGKVDDSFMGKMKKMIILFKCFFSSMASLNVLGVYLNFFFAWFVLKCNRKRNSIKAEKEDKSFKR